MDRPPENTYEPDDPELQTAGHQTKLPAASAVWAEGMSIQIAKDGPRILWRASTKKKKKKPRPRTSPPSPTAPDPARPQNRPQTESPRATPCAPTR